MHTPDEAWQILCRELAPLPADSLPLSTALGHYLAAPLRADRDIPAADRAAMDGFAVRALDLEALPAQLRVIGEAAAGRPCPLTLAAGTAIRIFTGANIPAGADTVVPVEQTALGRFDGAAADAVTIAQPLPRGANIFRQGENARSGQQLLPAGSGLGPCQAGVAAACGHARISVHRLPRVALLQTGTELLPVSAAVAEPHHVRDSNGPTLEAALIDAGIPVVQRTTVADERPATAAAIARALQQAEVVLLTGGVSVGQYDHVAGALADLGARLHYHGVAIKPGKPQLFATLAGGGAVFGLPGNPLSAIIGLYELVLPALRLLAGCPADACRPLLQLPLTEALTPDRKRQRIIAARLAPGAVTGAAPLPVVGSADLVTAALAEGAILIPPGTAPVAIGTPVAFRLWRSR